MNFPGPFYRHCSPTRVWTADQEELFGQRIKKIHVAAIYQTKLGNEFPAVQIVCATSYCQPLVFFLESSIEKLNFSKPSSSVEVPLE
jgi:hypothetical protein